MKHPELQPTTPRQAEPCIPCVDQWPLDQMDCAVRGAYEALSKRGEITVQKIRVSRRQNLCVMEYLSTLPPDWTRQALKKEKEQAQRACNAMLHNQQGAQIARATEGEGVRETEKDRILTTKEAGTCSP